MDMLLEAILAEQPFYPKQQAQPQNASSIIDTAKQTNETALQQKVTSIENTERSSFHNNHHVSSKDQAPVQRQQQVASIQQQQIVKQQKQARPKDPERQNKPSSGQQFMSPQVGKQQQQQAAPSGQNTQANEFNQSLATSPSTNMMNLGKFESDQSQIVRIHF